MAEYLASIFGTEKDNTYGYVVVRGFEKKVRNLHEVKLLACDRIFNRKMSILCAKHQVGKTSCYQAFGKRVNCSFFFKIGACRHGERCSRLHNKPTFSQTILLQNLYLNPQNSAQVPDPTLIGVTDTEMQEHYDGFFEEVFSELEDKYGKIEEMNVCDNLGDHLVGNVYIKNTFDNIIYNLHGKNHVCDMKQNLFEREEDAEKAVNDLNNRWFNGRPIHAELSPVTDFREACCRQYEMGECTRGGFCNFMHLKPISRELRRKLYGRSKKRSRSRSRSPPTRRSRSRSRSRERRFRDRERAGRF